MSVSDLLETVDAREMEEWVQFYALQAEDDTQRELNRRSAAANKTGGR